MRSNNKAIILLAITQIMLVGCSEEVDVNELV